MTFKRIRAQTLCIIAANAVSIILSVSLFISAALLSESQKTQFSAENWTAKNSKFAYSQQSAFIGNDAEFTTDSLDMVRGIISNEITNASIKNEENNRLWYDSYYSRIGKFQAHGTVLGNTECEINAVNGDFFMLHNFRLINGAFFSDNDLMQDYAVIDDNTAWKLFGSSDVVGMSFTVNNNDFYVSGVIERPKSKGEIEYYGKSPEIYISYDSASAIIGEEYSAISCYEAVLPEPVENFASKTFKTAFEAYSDSSVLITNTDRFSFGKRMKALKNISSCVAPKKPVIYPWWENAARKTEFRLSFIYLFALLALIIPLITVIVLLVKLYRHYRKQKRKLKNKLSDIIDRIRTRKYRKKLSITAENADISNQQPYM